MPAFVLDYSVLSSQKNTALRSENTLCNKLILGKIEKATFQIFDTQWLQPGPGTVRLWFKKGATSGCFLSPSCSASNCCSVVPTTGLVQVRNGLLIQLIAHWLPEEIWLLQLNTDSTTLSVNTNAVSAPAATRLRRCQAFQERFCETKSPPGRLTTTLLKRWQTSERSERTHPELHQCKRRRLDPFPVLSRVP